MVRRGFAGALIGLMLLVGSLFVADAFAAVIPVPPLTTRVTDQTGTLDSGQTQALDAKLAAFEKSKGSQFAVLIVPTTGDETIEQFSIRVVDQWKLGRKGVDDGALLLVAKDDRKARIEVGRGLEGVIPDAIANRIIDEDLRPKFREGDFAGGLQSAVDRMIGLVNGEALPPPKPEGEYDKVDRHDFFTPLIVAFFIANALRQLLAGVAPIGRASVTGVVVTIAICLVWSFGLLALGLGVSGFLFGLIPSSGGRFAGSGRYGGWGGGWGGGSGGGGGFGGGGFSGGGGGFSGGGASGGW